MGNGIHYQRVVSHRVPCRAEGGTRSQLFSKQLIVLEIGNGLLSVSSKICVTRFRWSACLTMVEFIPSKEAAGMREGISTKTGYKSRALYHTKYMTYSPLDNPLLAESRCEFESPR